LAADPDLRDFLVLAGLAALQIQKVAVSGAVTGAISLKPG